MKSSEVLLTIRQSLISIFKKYEMILLPIIKFIISFIGLHMLIEGTAYTGTLNHIIPMIAIALIGAFASAEWIEVVSIFLVVITLLPSNPILAILCFLVLVMIYILYGRLFPGESLLIMVTLMAFAMHIELIIPIVAALFGSYACIISIIIGTVIWFIMPELRANLPNAITDKDQIIDTINQLISFDFKGLLVDETMMVMIIVFFIVFSTIYIIRKLSIDYGAYIAICIGAVMNIIGFGLASIFFIDIHINLAKMIIETIIFSLLAVGMQFLSSVLDYQSAETVSFEDDDNYYYVKIIPKIKLSSKQKKVKKVYTDLSHTIGEHQKMIKEDDFQSNL